MRSAGEIFVAETPSVLRVVLAVALQIRKKLRVERGQTLGGVQINPRGTPVRYSARQRTIQRNSDLMGLKNAIVEHFWMQIAQPEVEIIGIAVA